MALQITENRGMFSVYGKLNSGNANILSRHMSRFINPKNPVTLNLERVEEMDENAAFVLKQLYTNAMLSNSVLSIIGLENNRIAPVMKNTKTAYILSYDRV